VTVILFLVRNACIDKLELAQCFVMVEGILSCILLCRLFSPHIFKKQRNLNIEEHYKIENNHYHDYKL